MKFSLKTYLITLCVGGAAIGVMGNLLLNEPELFVQVLYLAATIGPFALAIGTIVWLGVKERRRGLVAWGGCLIAIPLLLLAFIALVMPTGNALRLLSTKRLIEQRLPKAMDTPWVWQELGDRAQNGKLTTAEADQAVLALVDYMKANKPGGWKTPLPWQDRFFKPALQAKLISPTALLSLCDAYYGTPVAQPVSPLLDGPQNISLQVDYGTPFPHAAFGVELVWDVKQVLLNGKPLPNAATGPYDGQQIRWSGIGRFVDHWNKLLAIDLEAGDHEFVFELEGAYIDASKLSGQQAWQVPLGQWPKALQRWTTTVKLPFKVEKPKP